MGTGRLSVLGRYRRAALTPLRCLGEGVLDATLPQTCVACGLWLPTGAGWICPACRAALDEAFQRPACPRCGRTLPAAAIHERACARCRTEHFWNVGGVARVGRYEDVDRTLLLALKYRGQARNAEFLAEWLEAAIQAAGWPVPIDALVPVPMHWLRRLQRPCDHARLLAVELGRRMRVPVVRLVRRARHSPSQTGMLTKARRFENVRGCFAGPWWWRPEDARWTKWLEWRRGSIAGKTVCIVDNLLVTGATVTEVSKVLRRAGARRIYAAVIARPPSPGDPAAAAPAEADTSAPAVGSPPAAPRTP